MRILKPITILIAFFVTLLSYGQTADVDTVNPVNLILVNNFPVYPGCSSQPSESEVLECMNSSIALFISQNFKYPPDALKVKTEGKIVVNFIIERDGYISNATITQSLSKAMDAEAIRVIQSLPQFEKPALINGIPVRMSYTVPINAKFQ